MHFKTRTSQKRAKNIFAVFTWLAVFFMIGWIVWGICCCVGNYNDNVYPFHQADAEFSRSLGTNNLITFAEHAEDGLAILEPYSGNQDWWYPTIRTDMDSIKIDIQVIINNSLIAANVTSYGSDAYQEALDNAKESLGLQMDRLDSVEILYAIGGKLLIAPIWIWIGSFIGTIIGIAILFCIWDNLDSYNYYDRY